jgi:hypothetical protein
MQIRTQVYCFVMFLAILLTGSLVHSQVQGVKTVVSQLPTHHSTAADPAPFYRTVSDRFHVPPQDVQSLAARGLAPTQVALVYFVSEHSGRAPGQVAAERQAGKSWRDIAVASGMQPEQFYYPLPEARKPFVNVYALFHQLPRERWTWNNLQLTDADLENMANLQLLVGFDGESAGDVVRMRAQGFDYVSISNMLLTGQKTAEKPQPASPKAVRS